jgi:hypothetical protein
LRSSEGDQASRTGGATSRRYTLEDELGTEDFAKRGWHRLSDLADYIAFLVDGRTLGFYAVGNQRSFERLVGLATVLKAATQWFGFDPETRRPRFIAEAERYLVDGVQGRVLLVPFVSKEYQAVNLRSGPVLAKKGGRGAAGRLHSLAALVARMVWFLEKVPPEELGTHLEAYRNGSHRVSRVQHKLEWVLPVVLADSFVMAISRGTLTDLLRAKDFRWDENMQMPQVRDAVARVLENADLFGADEQERRQLLEGVARTCVLAGLNALGIDVPKDLFRDRRADL